MDPNRLSTQFLGAEPATGARSAAGAAPRRIGGMSPGGAPAGGVRRYRLDPCRRTEAGLPGMARGHSIAMLLCAVSLIGAAQANERGFATRDDPAQLAVVGVLDRRDNIAAEVFYAYWRDVHGPLAARSVPHFQYWQHHLAAPDPRLLPGSIPEGGIAVEVAQSAQVEGLAESSFTSAEAFGNMDAGTASDELMLDEQNLFKGVYIHGSAQGNTRTLIDREPDGAPQGRLDAYYAILLLAANESGDKTAFRSLVTDRVAGVLANAAQAVKVRYHLFEPYAGSWDTPSVDNDRTQQQAYDAWIELGFTDRDAARAALARVGNHLASPGSIHALHAYPVREKYTLVYEGRPTLAGLRSHAVASLIDAVGADNQRSLPVLRILHGEDVQLPSH